MPLSIPAIYADIPLREYDPSFEGQVIRAWVNPTLPIVRARADITRETINILKSDLDQDAKLKALEELRPRRHAWLCDVIGHGAPFEGRWMPAVDELDAIYEQSPDFVRWLTERVSSALDAQMEREKKV